MAGKLIYFIPGRGESLTNKIGQIITDLGFSVRGREVIGSFERFSFSEQIALIRVDLQTAFWHSESVLVGHSFGAYLLLHALAEMEAFAGRVLLFSPVLGAGISKDGHFGSIPPRSKRLLKSADRGEFPAPRHLEIHTGADDHGCDPQLARRFAASVKNTRLHVVNGAGHQFDDDYLRSACEKFFARSSMNLV